MTTTAVQRPPRNGVDVPTLFATLDAEQLAALVEQSRRRSAVYDVLVKGTDVQIDVSTP